MKNISYLAPNERETMPNFYRRILQLKAQAPEVSDDQVIAQAIKALRAGPLHSHLVREQPKTALELHEQFTKFSKSEVQHFRKLEQHRKVAKPDEAPRPRYSDNQRSYPKLVRSIDYMTHRSHQHVPSRFLCYMYRSHLSTKILCQQHAKIQV
jgi:hypothetical protein